MQRLPTAAVIVAAFIVFGANIGGYDLWPPDEPRFGQVAREIMQSGNPIALTINGEPYKEKPPFLFWLIALVSAPFGDVSETTARVPSVVSGILAVLFTYLLALRLYGLRVAVCASFVLMTSALFWWEARSVRTDMLLSGCLTAALYSFWMHHETKRLGWLLAFYGAVCAAVFAKGPPGVVFPLLLAITFYWGRRAERRALKLGWGLLAITAVIAIWIIPAYMMAAPSPSAPTQNLGLAENLYRQTIGRFLLGVSKARPPYYYLENLPLNLFPWTLFLPWVIWFTWKRRRESDAMRFLLCWIVPALIFFSISSGKRAVYLLPLFPAVAIVVAYAVVELMRTPDRTWVRRTIGALWTLILLAMGAVAVPIGYLAWFDDKLYPDIGAYWPLDGLGISVHYDLLRAVSVLTAAALIFSIHALVATIRKQGRSLHFAMAGHFAGLAVIAATLLMPEINQFKGASAFCEPLRALTERGTDYRLYSAAFSREEYIFYAKHEHEPFLVEEWPLEAPADIDPAEFMAQQRALGNALRKATGNVAISDWSKISDAEVEKLRATSESVFSFAKAKSPYVDQFKVAVGESVHAFAEKVTTGDAAFLIVQEPDWRWLLPFAPELRGLELIERRAVGSERVLLLGNPAAIELVEKR